MHLLWGERMFFYFVVGDEYKFLGIFLEVGIEGEGVVVQRFGAGEGNFSFKFAFESNKVDYDATSSDSVGCS